MSSKVKIQTKLSLDEFLQGSTDKSTHLPSIPTMVELSMIRKGLRKKKLPDFSLLPDEFEHEGVGQFQTKTNDSGLSFEWKTSTSQELRQCSLSKLCTDEAHEKDRLELGWMIANFAKLDGLTYLGNLRPIGYEDYHQNEFNKLYAKQQKHFQNIENEWRHWSIVQAAHMLFD